MLVSWHVSGLLVRGKVYGATGVLLQGPHSVCRAAMHVGVAAPRGRLCLAFVRASANPPALPACLPASFTPPSQSANNASPNTTPTSAASALQSSKVTSRKCSFSITCTEDHACMKPTCHCSQLLAMTGTNPGSYCSLRHPRRWHPHVGGPYPHPAGPQDLLCPAAATAQLYATRKHSQA